MSRQGPHTGATYLDPDAPIPARVDDLVSRMTLDEKIDQMLYEAPAIGRLAVPAYNWWNECLHGVARAGVATVFPQAIGLAATWNPDLIHRMASAISDEARAKHHQFVRQGRRGIYQGLTFWSPNINIFRDPRWGRGQETYGEDPWLTARIGVAFVRGLQGDDPRYLKVVATPKHYAVHSGPEPDRHHFDARVSEKDLRETYLPAFRDCVIEGKAFSVMGAYNRTNGEPCCASRTLLRKILREEWGFAGYVVSDCGAICDIHAHHKLTARPPESAAMAVNNGCDLNCGRTYEHLHNAVEEGLITEEAIDIAVKRLFTARFRLGMFDPPEQVAYARIPFDVNDCDAHRELALEVARESIVLLKNEDGLLPLSADVGTIGVIGPTADSFDVLIGNYFGEPSTHVTLLQGIMNRFAGKVRYAQGCHAWRPSQRGFAEAIEVARASDVVVICLGLTPRLEGEEGDVANSDGGGDRVNLDLPGEQQALLEVIHATGKPVVLVLTGGSPLAVNWADAHVPAILFAWYPGQEGGHAVADAIFGHINPAGRLPITFPRSLDQVPDFADYAMDGRTYRFLRDEPLYPFGYGLSYTRFVHRDLKLGRNPIEAGRDVEASVTIENVGGRAGDEVVQLYVTDVEASTRAPIRELRGVQRIHLEPGASGEVSFTLTPRDLSLIDDAGHRKIEPGTFTISVGGCQPGMRGHHADPPNVLTAVLTVTGEMIELPY